MFRKTSNHKSTASISRDNTVTVMCDDGWDTIVDYRADFASYAEAAAHLTSRGYEEYDPNADLKAKGFVWNGYIYAMPEGMS